VHMCVVISRSYAIVVARKFLKRLIEGLGF